MTLQADLFVEARIHTGVGMRVVAGQAGEPILTAQIAVAAHQPARLLAREPRNFLLEYDGHIRH